MEFDLVLSNGEIFTDGEFKKLNIGISDGKIKEISEKELSGKKVVDCEDKKILPGLIDVHVHFRDLEQIKEESFESGSKAALHGGITSVIDMPNNKPLTDSIERMKNKFELAKIKMQTNYAFNFLATDSNLNECKKIKRLKGVPAIKVFMAKSTGGVFLKNLKPVFELSAKEDILLVLHAEDNETIEMAKEKALENAFNDPIIHSRIHSSEAEEKAVQKALKLQEEFDNRIHFAHISSKESLALILKAKKKTNKISFEVSINHLFLSEKMVGKLGNLGKVNPSLKTDVDLSKLWEAIKANKVDLIASDHAPHLLEEKQEAYFSAPSGIPAIEVMVPLLLNAVHKRFLSLEQLCVFMSENPARIFKLKGKGFIKKGFDADLTIIDFEREFTVTNELFTKVKWTPYAGLKLKGFVEKVVVNGILKYDAPSILIVKINGKVIESG